MAEFVKKAVVGYKKVDGGQSDPECTHVILEESEYERLLRKISDAEQRTRDIQYNAEKEISAAKQNASYTAHKATQEAQATVEDIRKELAKERAESAHQRELNANLLRIAKERANAERDLKPKKERCGYVVLHSEEKEYSFKDGNRKLYKVKLWETILQSPYSTEFAEAVVRKQIDGDLFPEGQGWIVGRLGITGRFNGGYERMREEGERHPEDSFYRGNIAIARQLRLKRNFRSCFWEVAIVHTKALGDVPEDLTPARKKPVQRA